MSFILPAAIRLDDEQPGSALRRAALALRASAEAWRANAEQQ